MDDPTWRMPSALAERPELQPYHYEYIKGFYFLSSSRSIGMGIGYIPMSEYFRYCEFYEIDDPEMFIEIVRAMDQRYVQLANEKTT